MVSFEATCRDISPLRDNREPVEKSQLQPWHIFLLWIITEGNNPEGVSMCTLYTLKGVYIYFTPLDSIKKDLKREMMVLFIAVNSITIYLCIVTALDMVGLITEMYLLRMT